MRLMAASAASCWARWSALRGPPGFGRAWGAESRHVFAVSWSMVAANVLAYAEAGGW